MPMLPTYPATAFGKVAVLMGGYSSERETSLASGRMVCAALQGQDIEAISIDVGRDIISHLLDTQFDRAFIALHGRGGEDGTLQGALEMIGLPYTGSGVLASALAMDKCRTKQIWQSVGLPTPAYQYLSAQTDWQQVIDSLGECLIVKPIFEGSSIGACKVSSASELAAAFQVARQFGPVMAERWVQGKEYTAAILHNEVLPLIRLQVADVFYDYKAKYAAEDTQYLCPCGLAPDLDKHCQRLALTAYQALGLSTWGRIDFMVDDAGPWLLEANTVPGMTDHSLVPMAAAQIGLDFEALSYQILAATCSNTDGVAR